MAQAFVGWVSTGPVARAVLLRVSTIQRPGRSWFGFRQIRGPVLKTTRRNGGGFRDYNGLVVQRAGRWWVSTDFWPEETLPGENSVGYGGSLAWVVQRGRTFHGLRPWLGPWKRNYQAFVRWVTGEDWPGSTRGARRMGFANVVAPGETLARVGFPKLVISASGAGRT